MVLDYLRGVIPVVWCHWLSVNHGGLVGMMTGNDSNVKGLAGLNVGQHDGGVLIAMTMNHVWVGNRVGVMRLAWCV